MAKLWNDEDTFVVTEAGNLLRNASEAIKRVRELHQPDTDYPDECKHCTTLRGVIGLTNWVQYPCPTIEALDGEIDGTV